MITGASSGFGERAARAFADKGDRVFGTMRDIAGRNAAKKAVLEVYPATKHALEGYSQALRYDVSPFGVDLAIVEPDPQWVVDAYLKLADMPECKRPARTVAGMTWGVDEVNRLTQPIQDAILKEMQLVGVLRGAGA